MGVSQEVADLVLTSSLLLSSGQEPGLSLYLILKFAPALSVLSSKLCQMDQRGWCPSGTDGSAARSRDFLIWPY